MSQQSSTSGPVIYRFAALLLKEKGISGLLSIGLVVFVCYMLLIKVDSMTGILNGIYAQTKVTNCILSGGIDGGCNVNQLFTETPNENALAQLSDVFFSGTIGGDFPKVP